MHQFTDELDARVSQLEQDRYLRDAGAEVHPTPCVYGATSPAVDNQVSPTQTRSGNNLRASVKRSVTYVTKPEGVAKSRTKDRKKLKLKIPSNVNTSEQASGFGLPTPLDSVSSHAVLCQSHTNISGSSGIFFFRVCII